MPVLITLEEKITKVTQTPSALHHEIYEALKKYFDPVIITKTLEFCPGRGWFYEVATNVGGAYFVLFYVVETYTTLPGNYKYTIWCSRKNKTPDAEGTNFQELVIKYVMERMLCTFEE